MPAFIWCISSHQKSKGILVLGNTLICCNRSTCSHCNQHCKKSRGTNALLLLCILRAKLLEKSMSLSFDMGINVYWILRDKFQVERMRIIIQKLSKNMVYFPCASHIGKLVHTNATNWQRVDRLLRQEQFVGSRQCNPICPLW